MKKIFVILLVLGLAVGVFATTTFKSTLKGRTLIGTESMVWGVYEYASQEAGTIKTGLSTIRGFGLTISTEANFPSPLKTSVSAGVITVTATIDSSKPSGYWWAVGR